MKRLFIFALACFTASCTVTPKVESLPDAELNKPYFIEFNVANQATYPNHFVVKMDPLNSGLTVKPIDKWYDTVHISGTPKAKQDIKIEISYLRRAPVGFFEDKEQKKFYQIKVKE